MPVYEYECKECGGRVELLRSVAELNTPVYCGECQKSNRDVVMKIVVGATPLMFSEFLHGKGRGY